MPDDDYDKTQREVKQWGEKKSALMNLCNGNCQVTASQWAFTQRFLPQHMAFNEQAWQGDAWETVSSCCNIEESCWSMGGQDANWSVLTFPLNSSNPSCQHRCENSLLKRLTFKNKSTLKKQKQPKLIVKVGSGKTGQKRRVNQGLISRYDSQKVRFNSEMSAFGCLKRDMSGVQIDN